MRGAVATSAGGGGLGPPHGLALQFDALGAWEDAVQNGVGQCRLPQRLVPHGHGQLAGQDGRAQPRAVLDDLQGVGGLVGAERPQQKVVDLLRYLDKSTYPEAGIIPMCRGRRGKKGPFLVGFSETGAKGRSG